MMNLMVVIFSAMMPWLLCITKGEFLDDFLNVSVEETWSTSKPSGGVG
jgi:hypothetical protein